MIDILVIRANFKIKVFKRFTIKLLNWFHSNGALLKSNLINLSKMRFAVADNKKRESLPKIFRKLKLLQIN